MISEKELLDRLIKEKLAKGKAEFKVGVGRKQIDMVFEKESEIWLIEAKKSLNFEALGQVLTYEKLYQEQFPCKKTLKLGIVCEEGDLEIEEACRSKGVKVFILPEKEVEERIEEAPICGVCGSRMVEEEGEYKCKTCEYFFGMSSMIKKCSQCSTEFGHYRAIEDAILNVYPMLSVKGRKLWVVSCPKCRKEILGSYEAYETLAELIKARLKEGGVTPYGLEHQLMNVTTLAKEFIDYCLGKVKPYFKEGKISERKAVSLHGIWKGVEINENAIEEAKHLWEKELWKQSEALKGE